MAAKIKSKGTALLMSIDAVYTAIPQLISISISGEKSQTMDTTTLDAASAFMTKAPNGFSDPCTISAEGLYDPADAVHAAFIALIAAPVATNFKLTYADAAPTSAIYSGAGFGCDKNVALADAVKATFTIETSGAPA